MSFSISRGRSVSSFSSHGSASSHSPQPDVEDNSFQSGRPFVEMISEHAIYKTFIDVRSDYDVRLVHGVPYLHWYVLVRMKESQSPYVTSEITTLDMTDIIPTTRNVVPSGGFWAKLLFGPTNVGTFNGSLSQICRFADDSIAEMERYHFVENNCQHFCNRLLSKMGLKTFPTTVGPELGGDDQGFDILTLLTRNIYDVAIGDNATVKETAMITAAVGAPAVMKGDVNVAYNILLPLADKWWDIGDRIFIDHATLDNIGDKYRKPRRALSEMLRVWFAKCPANPWKTLGDAVQHFDPHIASTLRQQVKETNM